MRIDRMVLIAAMALSYPVSGHAQDGQQPVAAQSADTLVLTLEEAVALALRDNRDLRSLRLWRVVDRFDLFLSHRAYYPSGGVALSAIRRKTDGQGVDTGWTASPRVDWKSPVGTSASMSWSHQGEWDADRQASRSFSASIAQPLLRGAGLDVNMAPLRQARIREALNQLNEEEAVASLIDQVTLAYRQLIQSQEGAVLARLSLERGRALLDTNTALIEAGRMAAADTVQTQSDVASQEVALLEAQRAVATARRTLLSLLALDPSTPLEVVAEVEVAPVQIDADEAVAVAMEKRRDLQASRLNYQALEISDVLARNSRLWDVSVVAGYDRYDGLNGGQAQQGHSIGLRVDIPLADFSGRRAELSSRTALHTARLAYDGALERAEAQVREAVDDVASRWRQLEAALRAQALAVRSLDIQQERLRAGRASNFEVLTLQASLRAADAQALSARIAYLNALTALDQKTGRTLDTWRISLDR